MRALALALFAAACSDPAVPTVLDGAHGFEVRAAVALKCPPDLQGQFWKVFVEGVSPASRCDMDLPRAIPVTC